MSHPIGRRPFALTCLLAMLLTLVAAVGSAQSTDPIVAIDSPAEGAHVSGIVQIAGWAANPAASTGTGVDAIDVYLDGPSGTGQFLGRAVYGGTRLDVGTYLGNARFSPSGFGLAWDTKGLSAGLHTLYVYVHSTDVNLNVAVGSPVAGAVSGWSLINRSVVSAAVPTKMFPLTVTVTGSGTGVLSDYRSGALFRTGMSAQTTQYYPEGTVVTLGAAADPGSAFVQWDGDCSAAQGQGGGAGVANATTTNPTCTITMTSAKSATATMNTVKTSARLFPLTVIATGVGSGQVKTGLSGAVARTGSRPVVVVLMEGTSLTLTALADGDSSFSRWSGECVGTQSTCNVLMSQPRTVTAEFSGFALLDAIVDVALLGQGVVSFLDLNASPVRGHEATRVRGTQFRLKATPDPGFRFVGWGGDASGSADTIDVLPTCPAGAQPSIDPTEPTCRPEARVTATFAESGARVFPVTVQVQGIGTHEVTIRRPGSSVPLFHAPDGALVVTDLQDGGTYELEVQYQGVEEPLLFPVQTDSSQPGKLVLRARASLADVMETWKFVFGPKAGLRTINVTVVCGGTGLGKVRLPLQSNPRVDQVIDCASGEDSIHRHPAVTFEGDTEVVIEAMDQKQGDSLLDKFGGWGGDCQAAGLNKTCKIPVSGPATITATFNRDSSSKGYALVCSAGSGGAIDCGNGLTSGTTPRAWVPACSTGNCPPTIPVEAKPYPGYSFVSWGRDCSGSVPTCSVTLDRNRSVTASFARLPYTYIDSPLEGATITDTITFGGWAFDSSATEGTGIDAVHVYFVSLSGQRTFLGAPDPFDRPDVAEYFRSQFPDALRYRHSGVRGVWKVPSNTEPGKGALYVYYHSLVSGWSFVTRNITVGGDSQTYTLRVDALGTGCGDVSSNPAGILHYGCGSQTATFAAGTIVRLIASPNADSVFTEWMGVLSCALSSSSVCTLTMNANHSILARFERPWLSVTHAGTGSGSVTASWAGSAGFTTSGGAGVTQTVSVGLNTGVYLTATPDAGSTFSGWSGAALGTPNPVSITMAPGANRVTATFNKISYTLTVKHTGSGSGSVTSVSNDSSTTKEISTNGASGTTQTETFNASESVILTVTPAAGSVFTGWTTTAGSGGGCLAANTTCAFFMTASTVLEARFDAVITAPTASLTVLHLGTGSGSVVSAPAGISTSGGSGTTSTPIKYPTGTVVTLTATPAAGSTFAGWVAPGAGTCVLTASPCSVTLSTSTLLTATFNTSGQSSYTLTVTHTGTGSGSVTTVPAGIATSGHLTTQTATFAANQPVTVAVTPASGSVFTGWTTVTGSPGSCTGGTTPCVLPMTGTTSLQARFDSQSSPQTFALTVAHTGTGSGSVTSTPGSIATSGGTGMTQTATFAANQPVTLTVTPASGSVFTGWTTVTGSAGSCTGGTTPCVLPMAATTSLQARFDAQAAPQTFALMVTHAGTGSGSATSAPAGISTGGSSTTQTATYAAGTSVTLTAAPAVGSIFAGWSGGCSGTGTCTVTMSANQNVTATFTLQNYTLTVTHAGTGLGTVTSAPAGISTTGGTTVTQSISLPAGTLVTLTATASAGSTFGGWGGVGCAASPCNVTMNANVAVTATFTLQTFTLTVTKQGQGAGTVTSNPAGINAPTVPVATFPANQNVTLSAIPAPGSLFDAWGGACATVPKTSPCTLTMTSNLAVTATFIINPVP